MREKLSSPGVNDRRHRNGGGSRTRASGRGVVRAVAFWSAALLWVAYLPLLGLAALSALSPVPGLVLLGLHAVAIYLGHGHRPHTETRRIE